MIWISRSQDESAGIGKGFSDPVGNTQSGPRGIRPGRRQSLLDKVKAPWSLQSLLAGIEVADDLDSVLKRRQSALPAGRSITPEGYWLGPNWLRVTRQTDESAGVLAREEELRGWASSWHARRRRPRLGSRPWSEGQSALHAAEQAREETQSAFNEVNRRLSEIRSGLSGKRTRADHLRQRREQLLQEQREIGEQIGADRQLMEETRATAASGPGIHGDPGQPPRGPGAAPGSTARSAQPIPGAPESAAQPDPSGGAAGGIHAHRSAVPGAEPGPHAQSVAATGERREELQESLAGGAEPFSQQKQALEQKLARRIEVEKELAAVRSGLEGVDLQLRELEQERHRAEQRVQERRNDLDPSRLQRQEILVRSKTLEEQLRESGLRDTADSVRRRCRKQANETDWQARVEQLATRIQRLGPINLAAIDEFQEQSERLKYLDEQFADITQSLETLETAIRKIDRETRTRFKETFDKVNAGIKELFPRLFGGGHAYLELTGDDLLDTGVTVMARPPGKRNSSIHLLSGGEKALTAVALVFSIFQLNPAPFCMLDEVDAPLDDANVGRFCDMVKSMSDRVQFIFITHNKITMEIANQLSGVTMHEPGVSRLVTVDVEEAAQLAAI